MVASKEVKIENNHLALFISIRDTHCRILEIGLPSPGMTDSLNYVQQNYWRLKIFLPSSKTWL